MGGGALGFPPVLVPALGGALSPAPAGNSPDPKHGDPHLRSIKAVTGYHVHATDGAIGHLENYLVETNEWFIRYLIINTRDWWTGRQVLMAPDAVLSIDWANRQIRLDVSRDQVRTSPPWSYSDDTGGTYEEQLRTHYGWPSSATRMDESRGSFHV